MRGRGGEKSREKDEKGRGGREVSRGGEEVVSEFRDGVSVGPVVRSRDTYRS